MTSQAIEQLRLEVGGLLAAAERIGEQLEAIARGLVDGPEGELDRDAQADPAAPQIVASEYAVTFGGRQCVLGNGIPWRALSVLLRRPGRCVCVETLAELAWRDSLTSKRAIAHGMARLRSRLREEGMHDLAAAITSPAYGTYTILPTWATREEIASAEISPLRDRFGTGPG